MKYVTIFLISQFYLSFEAEGLDWQFYYKIQNSIF